MPSLPWLAWYLQWVYLPHYSGEQRRHGGLVCRSQRVCSVIRQRGKAGKASKQVVCVGGGQQSETLPSATMALSFSLLHLSLHPDSPSPISSAPSPVSHLPSPIFILRPPYLNPLLLALRLVYVPTSFSPAPPPVSPLRPVRSPLSRRPKIPVDS